MLAEIEKLLTLQERDQRIRSFELELSAIPGEIAAKKKQIAASADRLESSKTRMKQIEVDRKSLELEVGTKQEQIARYRNQQLETRKNEEYAALGHEIAAAEKAISEIEDRELVFMEEAESLQPAIESSERLHAEEKGALEAQIANLEAMRSEVTARIKELSDGRAALAEGIDVDLLDVYSRLFKSKAGNALVELDGEVCTGCHVKVTTQTVIGVKSENAVIHCPNCGRILFLPR